MRITTSLLALALAAASFGAQAGVGTTQVTSGPLSLVSGVTTVDFDSLTPAGISYSGGNIVSGNSSGVYAAPPGDLSHYLTVGPSTPATATFGGAGASYFGFLLGSPDAYNSISFTDSKGLVTTLTGSQLVTGTIPPINADGNQGNQLYFNVWSSAGTTFKSVTFNSTSYAMETDNHSFILAAVPEPETYAMLLAGLGLVGFAARRRAKKAA